MLVYALLWMSDEAMVLDQEIQAESFIWMKLNAKDSQLNRFDEILIWLQRKLEYFVENASFDSNFYRNVAVLAEWWHRLKRQFAMNKPDER